MFTEDFQALSEGEYRQGNRIFPEEFQEVKTDTVRGMFTENVQALPEGEYRHGKRDVY
jgi:hypothetical protein